MSKTLLDEGFIELDNWYVVVHLRSLVNCCVYQYIVALL